MPKGKHVLPSVIGIIALMISGCGTYVPEIQEIPGADAQRFVQAIVGSIKCEIKDAVVWVINDDQTNAITYKQQKFADWLLGWGAQIQLTLQVNEQSAISPSGLYSPMKIFFLGGGANLSSSATRINVINYYYTVPELYGTGKYCTDILKENTRSNYPLGSLLIQSDLKLREWLLDVVRGLATDNISFDNTKGTIGNDKAKNALSHEVKFEIVTSGNITPMWKLVNATIFPNSPFFSTSRDRTHDLLITFGPNDPASNSLGVGTPAANLNLSSQIGISNGLHINGGLP
jgi:hypothetical protein